MGESGLQGGEQGSEQEGSLCQHWVSRGVQEGGQEVSRASGMGEPGCARWCTRE